MTGIFADRIAVLATMHRKQEVIAPVLKPEGITVVLPDHFNTDHFNTDHFGTFTRERERPGTQLETARLKAKTILKQTGASLALASEGSFGPHPSFPMVPCDRELVLLLDIANGLELVGEELSLETNYRHQTIRNLEEAQKFAKTIGFPSHGLIGMVNAIQHTVQQTMAQQSITQQTDEIIKGITTDQQLAATVEKLLGRSPTGTIHLETDMRALYNPTRMKVIEQATRKLVQAMQSNCPDCGSPGFAIVEHRPGLPCDLCGLPTGLIRSTLYRCQKCHFSQEVLFPNGIKQANPAYCNYCNP